MNMHAGSDGFRLPPKLDWTDERIEQLKRLYADKMSFGQIAKALGGGVTRNAVISKVHRLGWAKEPRRATTARNANAANAAGAAAVRRIKRARSQIEQSPLGAAFDLDPGVDVTHLCGIMELTSRSCLWPSVGDGADTLFCGKRTTEPGKPYCAEHDARSRYQG